MNVDEARRWLRYAREDLSAAEAMLGRDDAFPRHICWLAQQAAEKAIKAALIFAEIDFPYRHDLDLLRDLLPDGWRTKTAHPDLAELTQWAVEARYPSDMPDIVEADAQNAVQQARGVWDSICSDLQERRLDTEV